MKRWSRVSATVALAVLLAGGCGKKSQSDGSNAAREGGEPIVTAPTLDELKRGTYLDLAPLPASVTLANGRWEGAPAAGGASRAALQLVRDFRLVGDLDHDGDEDAVVLLAASTGGTGELEYLSVVAREGIASRHAASALLGDRVQVREARIDGNRIVLGLVQAGKSDALCCPGELVERSWTFSPAGLKEDATITPQGRLSLATLQGTEWTLRWWSSFEDYTPDSDEQITAHFEGDRITGVTGCNEYFVQVTAGKAPGDVSVSPVGGTHMACMDPLGANEHRFESQLVQVKKFGFVATQLALTYELGGGVEVMLFDARPTGGQ